MIFMDILSKSEIEKVRKILGEMKDEVKISVLKDSSDFSNDLENFSRLISSMSGKICFELKSTDGSIMPGIIIGNIFYHALPTGMELESFLRTIVRIANEQSDLDRETAEQVRQIEGQVEVIVFVIPICLHCAGVVEKINQFAIENSGIKAHVIDISHFPDLENEYGIMSAPTVIINKKVKLVNPSERELFEWINRKEDEAEYFAKLLKDGRIDELENIIEKNLEKLEILVELLKKPEIAVRLGVMILLVKIFHKNPEKMRNVKPKLGKLLEHEDTNIVQDAIMTLGKIGDKSDIEQLEKLLNSNNKDVKEAAEEALEEIRSRLNSDSHAIRK
jgi:thioredoxin-like negative regulator of GroEL